MEKTTNGSEHDDELPKSDLYYNVEDNPPIGTTIFFGFQMAVSNLCFLILLTVMLTNLICADQEFSSSMFSTVCVISGFTTIVQIFCGTRMPIFQGPALVFFIPFMMAAGDPRWGCNAIQEFNNRTVVDYGNMTGTPEEDDIPPWTAEWAKITGSLMAAQVVQVILALTGTVALLMRLIRPITIAVIFILLGVWVHGMIAAFTKVHWGISATSIFLVLLLSQYINWVKIPMPAWTRTRGFHWVRFPLFELFAILFAVLICWAMSAIITAAGGFPDDPDDIRYNARTDISYETIRNAPVFRFPYPGQFSSFDFRLEYFILHLVGIVMTIMESMGDYCQYAVTCCLPRPPDHAFNRGIFVEGCCGFLAALFGMGHPTTSYSNVIGIIRVTRVASRRVYVVGGVMLIILGVFGNVGAALVSIPKPVLAGPVYMGLSLLVGSSFANLKNADLGKARNQTTLGCSIMLGVFVPFYFGANAGDIDTGSTIVDRIIIAIITVPYLVGGIAAIILDNTLPGRFPEQKHESDLETDEAERETPTERLLQNDLSQKSENLRRRKDRLMRVFDPPLITKYTRRWNWTRYIPILPNPYPRGYDAEERHKGEEISPNSLTETDV